MRLPYVDDDPKMATAEDDAIVERVKDRRGGKLVELDKALLHAPQLADGWNHFLEAVRQQTAIDDSLREIIMCRVAVLNQAWYEWHAHMPLLKETGALSDETVERLEDRDFKGDGLDERHKMVLHFVDASTLNVVVPQGVFDKIRSLFNDREVVEITGTCAAYNCVSRLLVPFDVGEMEQKFNVDMS